MPVDTAELEAFLAGRYVATMATYRADGTAHLTANWYLYEDGAIYLPTSSRTVKARHVLRDPRCSVMVDSRGPAPMRGGGTSGPASVITGAEAAALNERTWLRYLTPAGLDDPAVGGLLKAYDDVSIRVECGEWSWWDMGPLFGDRLESPDLSLGLSP